ncbi:hypothetical protein HF633_12725, partial [Weissella cibaria]|nr:hypothetical protein [Weissella cibaria]
MMKIEEKLLLYTELSPAERREVDAYAAGHPEWKAPWEEARAFAALLHRAGTLRQDPPSDEVLAYYVATRRMERHPGPAPLQEVFEWLEARLAEDAGLQQRCNQLEQRMHQIEAAGDFARRFEELTG